MYITTLHDDSYTKPKHRLITEIMFYFFLQKNNTCCEEYPKSHRTMFYLIIYLFLIVFSKTNTYARISIISGAQLENTAEIQNGA